MKNKEYMKKKSSRPWRNNFHLSSLISHLSSLKGFTLIELIIVISVAAVISVIGIAAFVSYSQSQSLNSSAADIANMFNVAKSRAASGVKPSIPPCSTQNLDGYRVTIIQASGTYRLDAVCFSGISSILVSTLPSTISFTSVIPATGIFTFSVLTGGFSGGGQIVLSGFNKTKPITVDSLGNAR